MSLLKANLALLLHGNNTNKNLYSPQQNERITIIKYTMRLQSKY